MKTPISKSIAVILTAGVTVALAACSSQSSQSTADSSYATAVQTTATPPETVSATAGTSAAPEATAKTKPDTAYAETSTSAKTETAVTTTDSTTTSTTASTTTAAAVTAVTSTTPAAQTTPLTETTAPKSDTTKPAEKYDSYTSSGYQPLDDIIFPILDEIITRDMTEADKCLAVYDYLLQYDYVERTLLIPKNQKKYSEQLYAISLFEKKCGICYDFSAAFKFMTRAVGVDTLMYYGQHSSYHSPSGYIPHTWDVIERDGVPYIYDIAMERITMDAGREDSYHCRYGITYEGFPGYYYIPDTFTR